MEDKETFDWNVIFRVLLCLLLGGGLYLFIRNNRLLTLGIRIFQNPEALVMFAVLGIPFALSLLHLLRSFRHPTTPAT